MTTTTARPAAATVGTRAAEILDLIKGSDEYARLEESTRLYPDCWATFTGYPIIAQWDLSRDAGPLFAEALRGLALKSAVNILSGGGEERADMLVSARVDEVEY